MKKEILFIAATHGDEKIGVEVLRGLEKNYKFDWIVGNERALKINRRFVDFDLNRSAPGDKNSAGYEKRRAFEILKIASDYKAVIDIHDTTADSGIFTIVDNPTPENLIFAASLPIKNVVIWVAKKKEKISPLSEYFDCGLEIECGPKDSKETEGKLKQILEIFIRDGITFPPKDAKRKKYFQVYDRLNGEIKLGLTDFKKYNLGGEEFYPILTGQYPGIACYKMKEVDWLKLFSY